RTREKGFPNNSRRAVPCNRGSDTAHAGEGAILGPRRRICRGVSWPRILPRIRSASVYLVNFSRLRRLARSWWSTCARSPRWTKKRAVTMKKLLLTSIAVLFLATGIATAQSPKVELPDAMLGAWCGQYSYHFTDERDAEHWWRTEDGDDCANRGSIHVRRDGWDYDRFGPQGSCQFVSVQFLKDEPTQANRTVYVY